MANQRNSRVDNNGNTGGDFVVVQPNESLQRGVGYRLVTGSQQVRLKAQGTGLQTISANSFALNLTRNVATRGQRERLDQRQQWLQLHRFPV